MRATIEQSAIQSLPTWQRKDTRLRNLALWDMYLDGTIYNNLPYQFHQDTTSTGGQISLFKRVPSTQFKLAHMTARMISRKLFAGRHAPSLILDDVEKLKKIQDLVKQSCLIKKMLNIVTRGSVGSVCATFKFVPSEENKELQLVVSVERAVDCFPKFNAAEQLRSLLIAKQTVGSWFIDNGVIVDVKGDPVEARKNYWLVTNLDKEKEVHYKPIRARSWNPYSEQTELLQEITEGELAPVEHKLGMVPAHWFTNLSGGEFPNGECLFEPALDNVIAYDYLMSQVHFGELNTCTPITVITGRIREAVGDDGRPIPNSNRVIQFEATTVTDGDREEGGSAEFLETNGMAFESAQAQAKQIKKDANEQICASRIDVDKVTTAMSGKGMELAEEGFTDLVMEMRTSYGEEGFLPLVKKMTRAAVRIKYPPVDGLDEKDADELDMSWPDLHEMSAQDQQLFTAGLEQGQEAGVIDQQSAHDVYRGKMDIPQTSKKLPKKKEKPKSTNTQGK